MIMTAIGSRTVRESMSPEEGPGHPRGMTEFKDLEIIMIIKNSHWKCGI